MQNNNELLQALRKQMWGKKGQNACPNRGYILTFQDDKYGETSADIRVTVSSRMFFSVTGNMPDVM